MKTREIKPNQDFKHEKKTYKKGKKYKVSLEDAKYFTSAGWVGDPGRTIVKRGTHPDGSEWIDVHDAVIGKEQSLEIHDVYEGHEAEVN